MENPALQIKIIAIWKLIFKKVSNVLKEILIIFSLCFFGETVSQFLKLPIPGSIIGMVALFLLLQYKILKLSHIKNFSRFMLKNLGLFFIPPGVALMSSYEILKENFFKLLFIIISSTIIVAVVTAVCVQLLIKNKGALK